MEELVKLAEMVKAQMKIEYNAEGVKYLEGFIERQKGNFSGDQITGLVNSCGSFLGQCIIVNYGGKWHKGEYGVGIMFDDKNIVYPFNKTRKQFEGDLPDSIYAMYTMIPSVFKLPPKSKKKWWQF